VPMVLQVQLDLGQLEVPRAMLVIQVHLAHQELLIPGHQVVLEVREVLDLQEIRVMLIRICMLQTIGQVD
jgi:hypothetical protein